MKVLILLAIILLLCGCASTQDQVTINLLNDRIASLERSQQQRMYCYVIIKNPNGSRTSVRLKLENEKYVGPNNEVYDTLPSADQLAPFYGLNINNENVRRTQIK